MMTKIRPKLIALFIARSSGLFFLSRHLTKSRLRILCYHGGAIGDESSYNAKLFCSSKTLHNRMAWMKRNGFNFVKLDDGVEQQLHSTKKIPLRAVVTFDDGWYSTASELVPVLSRMGVPSTLYLSTLNFLEGWPILSVAVRYIIWKANKGKTLVQGWGKDVDAEYDLSLTADIHRLANGVVATIEASANSREKVCAELGRFATCLNVPAVSLGLDNRRFDYLTAQELLGLADSECSIELHGHVHVYPKGDPSRLVEDLRKCSEVISGMGLPTPRHYCYPSGSFDAEASSALSNLGIVSATTCIPGLVGKAQGARRHYLPRFLDGEDVHPLEFQGEMSGFTDLVRNGLRLVGLSPRV